MLDTKLKDDKKIKKKDKIKNLFALLRQKLKPISPYIIVILIISSLMYMHYETKYENAYNYLKNGNEVSYITKFDREEWKRNAANDISTKIYSETQYLNAFETLSQNELNNISSKFLSNNETKFLVYNRKSKKIITNIDQILAPLVSNSEAKSVDEVLVEDRISALKNIRAENIEDKLKGLVRYYNGNNDTEFCLTSSGSPAVEYFQEHLNYIKNAQDYLEIFYPTDESRRVFTHTEQRYSKSEYDGVTWDSIWAIHDKRMNSKSVAIISIGLLLIAGLKNSLEEFKKSIFVTWAKNLKKSTREFLAVKGLAYKYIGFLLFSIAAVISSIFVLIGLEKEIAVLLIISIIIPVIYIFYILPKTFKFITNLDKIVKGSERIVSGDLNYSIDEEKLNGNLYKLASGINTIKKGFKVSIDEQVKNEKLKSELVANVSHDLKTPLTSIINYTDILMREGLTEEEKQEYIEILNRKSLKLKALIEALFEVSKINSGKVDIEKEEVNVIELLKQSIGEFATSAEERGLKFKLNTFSNEVIMLLDGKKMARVFENLISNAIKYSMENTRVFVEVEQREQGIKIWFKNISSYDMDFDINEIFERFSRADKSRTSDIEGNGLGLAIAKSIVELHEGNMGIQKDGDMFKVYMDLK